MSTTKGYKVFLGIMSNPKLLPVTPAEITTTYDGGNTTQTLISGQEINVIKPSKLETIECDFRIPISPETYSTRAQYEPKKRYTGATWLSYFQNWKNWRNPTNPLYFVVVRDDLAGRGIGNIIKGTAARAFDTVVPVTLESYTVEEKSYNEIIVKCKFKRYRAYGTTSIKVKKAASSTTLKAASTTTKTTTATAQTATPKKQAASRQYTIKSGDTLPRISQAAYGTTAHWTTIYNANKATIEQAAKQHGKASSDNGHWIWPGTVLTLPAV